MLGTCTQAQLRVSGPQPGVPTAAGRPGPPAAAQALLWCPSPPARPSRVLPSSRRTQTFLVDRPPTGTPLVTHRCAMSQVSSMSLLPTLSFPCSARCRAQVDRAVTRERPLRRGQARLPVGTRPAGHRGALSCFRGEGHRRPPGSSRLGPASWVLVCACPRHPPTVSVRGWGGHGAPGWGTSQSPVGWRLSPVPGLGSERVLPRGSRLSGIDLLFSGRLG